MMKEKFESILIEHEIYGEDAEEMAERTAQHKEMPDRMVVGEVPPEVEHAPSRVKHTAKNKPHQPCRMKSPRKRENRNDRNPPHRNIGRR